jgi:hypothetical protein
VPAFEEVEPDVRTGWIEDRRAETREKAFEAMRARYEVVLPKELSVADLTLPPDDAPPLAAIAPQ